MVVDLLEKGQVNIKDLVLPTPESRRNLPFDSERNLTEKDWELLERNLELCSKQDSSERKQYLPILAKQASLLFPDRVEEMMPMLTEVIWEREKQKLTDVQGSKFSEEHLSNLKLIFPEQFREIDMERYWDTFKGHYDKVVSANRDPDPETILHYAVWMKILYPEKSDQITLDDSSLKRILNELGIFSLGHTIHIAARLRLISEEAFSNIRIDNNDWQSMKSHLGTLKSSAHEKQDINSAYQFFNHALNMKILAEPFVQITQNGLEFTKPVKPINLQPTIPSLPERRAF